MPSSRSMVAITSGTEASSTCCLPERSGLPSLYLISPPVHGAACVLMVRTSLPRCPAHLVALLADYELPRPTVSVRFEMVVLGKSYVIFDHRPMVRLPRSPLTEDTVETAVLRRGTVRADARRVEGEIIAADQYVLGLPTAVAVVRLAGQVGEAARACRHQPRVDQGAFTRRGVGGRAAVPVGVLP